MTKKVPIEQLLHDIADQLSQIVRNLDVALFQLQENRKDIDRNREEIAQAKAIGGYARAKALSPERRKEIGQQAAAARWMNDSEKEE